MTMFTTSQTIAGIPMTIVELTDSGLNVNFDAIRGMQRHVSDLEEENQKLREMLESFDGDI
jgi:hypothetical protein